MFVKSEEKTKNHSKNSLILPSTTTFPMPLIKCKRGFFSRSDIVKLEKVFW